VKLGFVHGPAACGKYTVSRRAADRLGWPLFHNHLVVDAVAAVFDFGSEPFVRLRESFWLQVFDDAAREDRSLLFTFQPEATVAEDLPDRVVETVERHGGEVVFVALECPEGAIEERIEHASRSRFGKLRSLDDYRRLRDAGASRYPEMPAPRLRIDTSKVEPGEAGRRIAELLAGP